MPVFNKMEKRPEAETIARLDYLLHFAFHMLLGIIFVVWQKIRKNNRSIVYLWFLLFGIIYGFLTEYVQKYVPGRTYNIIDTLNNIAGIIFGLILGYFVIEIILKKTEKK